MEWREAMGGSANSTTEALKSVAGGLMNWSTNVLGDLEKRVKKSRKIWRKIGGKSW